MSLEEAKDGDVKKEVEGISFVVDKELDQTYQEILVDYRRNRFSEGFAISLK